MINFYNCNKQQTQLILSFLIKKCDYFTFCLPNYGTIFRTSNPTQIVQDYNFLKEKLDRNNDDFIRYKKNIENLLTALNKDIIRKYRSNQYFEQLCNYEKEIYVVKYNTKTMNILEKYGCFNNWVYPKLPEDLYFIKGNTCYFSIISHENEYSLYDDSDQTIHFIDEIGLEYHIDSFNEPPLLEEQLEENNQGKQSRDGSMIERE